MNGGKLKWVRDPLELLARPARTEGRGVRKAMSEKDAETHLFSNFWLTWMILVPSSGLMVFQGVGFFFVQMTAAS